MTQVSKTIYLSLIGIIFSLNVMAQQGTRTGARSGQRAGENKTVNLTGTIIENGKDVPLEYATVALYKKSDSTLVDGTITDTEGFFSIKNISGGRYFLKINFIGYREQTLSGFKLDGETIDLGKIALTPATESIGEVTVMAQTQAMTYDIDKKVVFPDKMITASGGSAVDILALTPSLSTDIDGNITMRGSSNFIVLLDGKPSPFDATDILEQIPASTIQSIEIITNPSAKYDPDGTTGIINIKSKKSKLSGVSGIVNISGNTNESFTGDMLLNYKTDNFNWYIGGNRSARTNIANTITNGWTRVDTDTTFTQSFGGTDRMGTRNSLKGGFDWYINPKNTLSFNSNYFYSERKSEQVFDFTETKAGISNSSLIENMGNSEMKSVGFDVVYKKQFNAEDHSLSALLNYYNSNSDGESYFNEFKENVFDNGQTSWTGGSGNQYLLKIDYSYPINQNNILELGYQGKIDVLSNYSDLLIYNNQGDYSWSENSPYYYESEMFRNIQSAYATFNGTYNKFGYQLGLRAEYTNRDIDFSAEDQTYTINRLDLYPTLHLSYQLPGEQQLIASYSRRINRPRITSLQPFVSVIDKYNVRAGNPDLLPEYIDSYELGYQLPLNKGFFSTEIYYRYVQNATERVKSVYDENILLTQSANVGNSAALGMESSLNYKLFKWWDVNLSGNFYNYKLDGEYNNQKIEKESFNWATNFNNSFNILKNTSFQINYNYNSPTVTSQGKKEGFSYTNLAVKQSFLDKKLSLTASVKDVFNTANFETTTSGIDFYDYKKYDVKSPVFQFTLSYRFNNFKQKQSRQDNDMLEFAQ